MINNLDMNAQQWKYVDDTTVSEVVVKGREIHVQAIADSVIEWSHENRVQQMLVSANNLGSPLLKSKESLIPSS